MSDAGGRAWWRPWGARTEGPPAERPEAAPPPAEGPTSDDLVDLRRVLYGLHAILRLHFAQEEEAYAWLSSGEEFVPVS